MFSIIQIQVKGFFCLVIRNLTSGDFVQTSVMHSAYFEAPKDNHELICVRTLNVHLLLYGFLTGVNCG